MMTMILHFFKYDIFMTSEAWPIYLWRLTLYGQLSAQRTGYAADWLYNSTAILQTGQLATMLYGRPAVIQ